MATTTNGFPYPLGTDRVMDGDNVIQALAQKTDDAFSGIAGSPLDTGWVTLTLGTGWGVVASHTPQIRRIGNRVQIRGMAQLTSGAVTQTITTLAAAYIPGAHTWLSTSILTVSKGLAQVMIATGTGVVSVPATAYYTGTPATNDTLSLNGSYLLG